MVEVFQQGIFQMSVMSLLCPSAVARGRCPTHSGGCDEGGSETGEHGGGGEGQRAKVKHGYSLPKSGWLMLILRKIGCQRIGESATRLSMFPSTDFL
jgi:hypothetical protein